MLEIHELVKATNGRLIKGNQGVWIKGFSIDSRTIEPAEVFIPIRGKNFDGHDFINEAIKKQASCIVSETLKQKVSTEKTAFIIVKDTTKALGDIASYHRQKFNIPVIAVTGSNGKTTAKEMVAWVLSGKSRVLKNKGTKNNQIGLPMTLLKLESNSDFAVLEAGSNHPGEIEHLSKICSANIGAITNIGPSHLEFLKDLKGVCQEKTSLLKYLKDPAIAILNADDTFLKVIAAKKKNKIAVFSFGINNKADFLASQIKRFGGRIEFRVNKKNKFKLNTLGFFNIYNALIAIAAGRIFGLRYEDISSRLSDFVFLKNRLNLIELKNIRFINDTYNSNPLSLKLALQVLRSFESKGRKILIMGDMLELGQEEKKFHFQAGQSAAEVCDAFVTVGKLSKIAAEAAKRAGFDQRNIFSCENSQQAREILFKSIAPGPDDVVLIKGSRSMKMEEVLNF